MNKREKIVQADFLGKEESIIKRLKQVYNQALKDIETESKALNDQINSLQGAISTSTDAEEQKVLQSMMQSKVYQKQYQDALKKQVGSILDKMQVEEFKSVSEYLVQCYENGFLGTLYDLHGQGIPLVFPMDQEAVVRAVQLDSKISQGLYSRLGEDVSVLKKKIIAQVSRGISTGRNWGEMARDLAGYTNIGFNNAVRITRTEGHRIQNQAAMDAGFNAVERGADLVKQWDSTLDGLTRASHRRMDGEIREMDEKFSNGLMYPSDPSGAAAEVIQCRCALLKRSRSELKDGFTKWNNFTGELEEFKSPEDYEEFKKAFFSEDNVKYMKYVQDKEKKYETYNRKALMEKLTPREKEHYEKLLENSPMYGMKVVKKKSQNPLTNTGEGSIMGAGKDGFKVIHGTHSINQDIGTPDNPTCNPKYTTGDILYRNNCGYCSATYEMRRRGFDVIANPKNTMYVSDWKQLFDGATAVSIPYARGQKYVDTVSDEILTKSEEGARGSLFVQWRGRRIGHFFSWEVKDGKVRFVDGQNGNTDASSYFERVKPSETICLRWDNLQPSAMIKEACRNKGGG